MRMKVAIYAIILIYWMTMPYVAGNRVVCFFNSLANTTAFRTSIVNATFGVNNINPNLCSHLVYASASLDSISYNIVSGNQTIDITLGAYSQFVGLKSKNPNLKTMISIFESSDDGKNTFSKMVASNSRITSFVNSVVKFLQQYKFDGLNLDWEVPSTPTDKAGFANLSRKLRTAFNPYGYLLSASTPPNITNIQEGWDLGTLNQTLDFINLMAYNLVGFNNYPHTVDNQAPLYKRSWETDPTLNVDYVVRYYINNGITPFKITLGIPFHGIGWSLLGGPCLNRIVTTTSPIWTMMYGEICYCLKNNGWQNVSDPLGQTGPHACSPVLGTIGGIIEVSDWVGYDDPSFAIVKSQYALKMGLGGVMVSDITQDDFRNLCGGGLYPMLTAISKTILKPAITTLKPTSTTKSTLTPSTSKPTSTSKSTSTSKTTSTSKPTATTKIPSSVATTKSPGPFKCSKNGFFPNPLSCYTFYNCADGVPNLMSCPTGLAFSYPSLFCDKPSKVQSCKLSG